MVGAGRFERAAPCAQDGYWPRAEMPYFKLLAFQTDGAGLLKLIELR